MSARDGLVADPLPSFSQHVETIDVDPRCAPFDPWPIVLQTMRDNAADAGLILHGEPITRGRHQLARDPRYMVPLWRYTATWLAEHPAPGRRHPAREDLP